MARRRRSPRPVRNAFLSTSSSPPIREVPSPRGTWLLTELDNDLALRATIDDRTEMVTSDGEPGYSWKVDGAAWSPDELWLAATKVDTRAMNQLPIVHWLKTIEEVEWFPYTKAGGPYPQTQLHIIDTVGRRAQPVDIGDEAPYFVHPIKWLASGELLILTLDRADKCLRLLAADRPTGGTRVVAEERQETFVYGIRYGMLDCYHLVADDREVLWLSERDGWRHFYRYGIDGSELGRVTSGHFDVERVVSVDGESGQVHLLAHSDPERPYDVHVCRVNLDGTNFAQLTQEEGLHDARMAPNRRALLDIHSSLNRSPRTDLLSPDGKILATVAEADDSRLWQFGWTPPEEFRAVAADGTTELHGVLWKPSGFDPTMSYPVVEYIYAGPQLVCHPRDFLQTPTKGIPQALAELGFVTFVVDGRGTPERGKEFQDHVYGRFGQYEIDDHAGVLDQLAAERPYLDVSRVGIVGGSWGGYMTIRALLTAPDKYHVGCALYPAADLIDHIAQAIEPYLGLLPDNPDAYRAGSSLELADRLEGNLLLIHGTSDVNGSMSATMKLVDAFARHDRPVDLLLLPELDHSVNGYGGRFALRSMARYLVEHLGPVAPVVS